MTKKDSCHREEKNTLRGGNKLPRLSRRFAPHNDTERVDNKILCHCEEQGTCSVAISPLNKSRLMAIIISIVLGLSVLAGAGAGIYFLTSNNSPNATTESATLTTNIYNTDGSMNHSSIIDLLTAVGYYKNTSDTGTYTAHNIASRGTSGSDNTIIFPMGYYVDASGNMDTSKPILWQATYLRNGYLTIWMYKNYVADYFNYSGTTNSGFGSGTSYSTYSNYSKSTLRDITNNIYSKLSSKLANFSTFIKSPSAANATWQATQTEDINAYRNSSSSTTGGITGYYYVAHHNGLQSYSGAYTGWSNDNWDSANPPYNDEFWIPSYYEVYNSKSNTTSTTGYLSSNDGGLWGLSATDRGFNTTTIEGSGTTSYCWLRSGSL
ncbi:MAG: hypothetical protein IJ301_03255 [Clostridia bacterium]|nr:hypothetical protein [Clostridia bacterium]